MREMEVEKWYQDHWTLSNIVSESYWDYVLIRIRQVWSHMVSCASEESQFVMMPSRHVFTAAFPCYLNWEDWIWGWKYTAVKSPETQFVYKTLSEICLSNRKCFLFLPAIKNLYLLLSVFCKLIETSLIFIDSRIPKAYRQPGELLFKTFLICILSRCHTMFFCNLGTKYKHQWKYDDYY